MRIGTERPELRHRAQDSDAPFGAEPGEGTEGRRGRRRVGVVGVVQDQRARRRAHQLHPPGRELGVRQTAGDIVERDVHGERGRGRRERVAHLVLATRPQRDRGRAPRRIEVERGAQLVVDHDLRRAHVARDHAERDDPRARPRDHRRHERVVGVEHGRTGRRERLDQLTLGPRHVLDGSEELRVRGGDGGDHAHARSRDVAQVADVPRGACSHLDDDRLARLARGEDRQGHTQLVVERAWAGGGRVAP